jgi:hypothetical protein
VQEDKYWTGRYRDTMTTTMPRHHHTRASQVPPPSPSLQGCTRDGPDLTSSGHHDDVGGGLDLCSEPIEVERCQGGRGGRGIFSSSASVSKYPLQPKLSQQGFDLIHDACNLRYLLWCTASRLRVQYDEYELTLTSVCRRAKRVVYIPTSNRGGLIFTFKKDQHSAVGSLEIDRRTPR